MDNTSRKKPLKLIQEFFELKYNLRFQNSNLEFK